MILEAAAIRALWAHPIAVYVVAGLAGLALLWYLRRRAQQQVGSAA